MPLATRSRYSRTSLTVPAAMTIVPGSHTSASALMSLSGSADSLRSTNRMFGLAETESDCTALRRPPLLTFSGDQPCSTATGRSMSAVASSQTKAVKGSRRPARAWNGAFMLVALLGVDFRQALRSARRLRAVEKDAPGSSVDVRRSPAFAAVDQILGVRDHCGEVGVHRAAEIRHVAVVEIGRRREAPVRAVRDFRAAAADHHPHGPGPNDAGSDRRTWGDHHAVLSRDRGHLASRCICIGAVDVDRVPVTDAEALEPAAEPVGLASGERS